MWKRPFAIGFPIMLVSGLTYLQSQAGAQGPIIERDLPDRWAPFSADVEMRSDLEPGSFGRFARDSQGSEYLEILTGLNVYATIKNIPQKTFYRRGTDPHGPWSAQPMILPPEGWQPIPSIPQSFRFVRLAEGYEGMEVYRHTFANGPSINLVVPDLNLFAVLSDLQVRGRRIRYYNIVRGEPQPTLFEPPTGVEVMKKRSREALSTRPERRTTQHGPFSCGSVSQCR